ncbi:AtpZ/AtpI family protein [Helicobacter saguini]|nr:AtpZ/AtpI family protein [Helicobacter saguini]
MKDSKIDSMESKLQNVVSSLKDSKDFKNIESNSQDFMESKRADFAVDSKIDSNFMESKLQDSKNLSPTHHPTLNEMPTHRPFKEKDSKETPTNSAFEKQDSKENTESKHILEGKMKPVIKGANDLSLGISMVVAVLLGWGLGYLLYMWLGYYWLIWVGLGYGFAAAFLNVYKAYKRLHKELESIKDDEKYKYMEEKAH